MPNRTPRRPSAHKPAAATPPPWSSPLPAHPPRANKPFLIATARLIAGWIILLLIMALGA